MPPKAKKAAGASPGVKKMPARTAKVAAATVNDPEPPPMAVKVDEAKEEERIIVEEASEAKHEDSTEKSSGPAAHSAEEDVKEVYEDEDIGERLELEDNEYEEEVMVDYDEKEVEQVDGQEEGDEGEDAGEEEYVEEEVYGVEDGGEEADGAEDDENLKEAHVVEEEEHQEIVKERRKRKEFEVFVGGLDKDATVDDLMKVFTQVGEVTEVRLMMNQHTKKNKGFAFLRFATVEQAKKAVSELKHPVVHGKQCGVAPIQDNDTLFLGNICKTWTKEHLKEKLKEHGVENIDDLTLVEDTTKGKNRGFAFVEFSSRSDAMDAFRRLQKRDISFGVDRPAKVSFADTYEADDEIMAQVKTVFIDGILPSWDEDRVKECIKKFGGIEKVELARNMAAARRKDFGFVTFDTHDSAVKCADSINNSEIGEGDNKIIVRARLSRPLQKSRGRHTVHEDYRFGHSDSRGSHASWDHPPQRLPLRPPSSRTAAADSRGYKRPISLRDRRPPVQILERSRRLPPLGRPYERRASGVPAYSEASSRRDYGRRDEPAPRSRVSVDYAPIIPPERRSSYREEYTSRESAYSDIPGRSSARAGDRRTYADDAYVRKFEGHHVPVYREGRSRDYDSVSGSKRPYAALDDAPRYADMGVRQSRARLDYGVDDSSDHYDDVYGERLLRSHVAYSGSRSSLPSQDSHTLYNSRQGSGYGEGSVNGSDGGGLYPSNFGSSYISRGSDVGRGPYSSTMYSDRGFSGSSYLGGNRSGPYY